MKVKDNTRLLKIAGYTLVFILFLAVFIYTGFPVDSVKKRIISEIKNNTPYEVNIGNISFPGSFNVAFEDVSVRDGHRSVNLDKVVMKPGISDLLSSEIDIPFEAKGLGGDITGALIYSRDQKSLKRFDMKISGIDASLIKGIITPENDNMELRGDIDGVMEINFTRRGSRYDASGNYNFSSGDFTISNIKIDSFSLPDYENLESELRGTFDTRQTKIEKLNFKNNDFELSFFGTMPPVWELSRGGKLDLFLNLNLYSKEAKMGFLKAFLSPQSDGTHAAKILGTVSNPRLVKDSKYEF